MQRSELADGQSARVGWDAPAPPGLKKRFFYKIRNVKMWSPKVAVNSGVAVTASCGVQAVH